MKSLSRGMIGAALVVAIAAPLALAGKHNTKLDIGDKAPKIASLPGTDGEKHSLADYADKKAMVVVFTCNSCPVAQSYLGRFNKFVTKYADKPVGFLAVSVNQGKLDNLAAMKTFAKKHDVKFTYAWDKSQETGAAYGATVTPHVFVLNQDREVVYMGAWDDNWRNSKEVEDAYALEAVEAVLAGKTPETTETLQRGCGIVYGE